MTQAWKTAHDVMGQYYRSKGIAWSAWTASEILPLANPDQNGRWDSERLVRRATDALHHACFNVDDLVENHLKIRLSIESLADLDEIAGSPVYGCAYPRSREIVVCERALAYEPLYRSTIMHELGHVLLHKEPATRCLYYVPDRVPDCEEEREANQFMHAALLPESVLKLGAGLICHKWGIDPRIALLGADSAGGRWVWQHRLLPELISILCVSRQMICIKMARMGRFSPETVRFHSTYVLETRWGNPNPGRPLSKTIKAIADRLQPARCVGVDR